MQKAISFQVSIDFVVKEEMHFTQKYPAIVIICTICSLWRALTWIGYNSDRRGAWFGILNTILSKSQPTCVSSLTNPSKLCCMVCRLFVRQLACPRTSLTEEISVISCESFLLEPNLLLSETRAEMSSWMWGSWSSTRHAWYMLRNTVMPVLPSYKNERDYSNILCMQVKESNSNTDTR